MSFHIKDFKSREAQWNAAMQYAQKNLKGLGRV